MKIDLSQFRETFLQESAEHLADVENGLLELKSSGGDDETLHRIFRAVHSIKGGAGAFGLPEVVKFAHVLENLFDRMRERQMATSAELITLLLRANDILKELLASKDGKAPDGTLEVQRALETAASGQPSAECSYSVSFKPESYFFSAGSDPLLLLRNLDSLGQVASVKADIGALPPLAAMETERSYLSWEVEIATAAPLAALQENFEFVIDSAVVQITAASSEPMRERRQEERRSQPAAARSESASVRVPTDKIDKLIDIVGEMVIAHSITTRLVEGMPADSSAELKESVSSLERHIRELHERTMSVRLLPIGSLFNRFHRLIHDLADKTGKKLRLITEGDDTEVDRSILEMLGDPLTHVLRNSADHGIEMPEARVSAGKDPAGTILLRASHLAGNILIEVIDDGAGLNLARIREKALARGLISAGASLTDEQIRLLIFEPGFSTKEQANDLSGRGVGMDVVKRNVASLQGSITLDSREGHGTHIKLQLPLTLAIIEGLIVRVASHSFVIPLVSILETVCLPDDQVTNVAGQGEVAVVRGEAMPLLRLRPLFGLAPAQQTDEAPLGNRKLAVVVEYSSQRAALEIDELLGQQQIVVKSLERNFTKLDGTLGATILGDGKAALILDVQALLSFRSKPPAAPAEKVRLSLVA